ncbi:hypothetical protein ES332_A08G132000v1, partial [Gossypium tomentosum]
PYQVSNAYLLLLVHCSYCFLLLLQLLVQLKLPFNLRINICYCFLLLLQLLVQLKLPFNLRINIWYYRAPELIFGATKYTTAIDICFSLCLLVRVE